MAKRGIWVAGTALASLLAGCGGGGSPNGVPRPGSSADYPGLANITTATNLSTLAESAVVNPGPSAGISGGGSTIQWSNTSIRVQVTNVGGKSPTMDFPLASLSNLTVGGLPFIGTRAPVAGTEPSSSQTILLSPIGGANGFDHTVLGRWTYQISIGTAVDTVGFFVAGTETRQQDLPTGGTASYAGRLLANLYQTGVPGVGQVVGNASGNANFATGVFNFSTTGSTLNAIPNFAFDVTGSLTRPTSVPPSNAWSGTIATTGGLNGSINGRCFGPACVEFGGTFQMFGSGQQMLGGILLRQ